MNQVRFLLLLLLISNQGYAFTCYITAVKDSCWQDFNVSITVQNYGTDEPIMDDLQIPKGKSWVRHEFECTPKQALIYKARYSPAIWQGKKQQTYTSKRIWYLPQQVKKGEVAWNIPICYGRDFSSVPLPPTVDGKCQCDFKTTPDIPGQISIDASK